MRTIPQLELVSDLLHLIGRKYAKDAPCRPRHLNAVIKAADAICAEYNRDYVRAEKGQGLDAWLASDDVGRASLAMAAFLAPMAGLRMPPIPESSEDSFPSSVEELRRCMHLLEVVPELSDHLLEMSRVSRSWAELVATWNAMKTLLAEGDAQAVAGSLRAMAATQGPT